MDAVIMAGGKGTRLSSITKNEIPKPMVKIDEKPILEHQVILMKRYHIKKIYMIIGHLGETIREYFGDGSKWEMDIEYIEETEPLGTGGGLSLIKSMIEGDILLVYGDLMIDVSIMKMYQFHNEKKADVTLFAHPNSHPFDSDIILPDENEKIVGWMHKNEERPFAYHNCVNAGMYIFSQDFVKKYIPDEVRKRDLEKDIIIPNIRENGIFAYTSSEFIKDAGTPPRLLEVEDEFKEGAIQARNLDNRQKCFFLDRDGTLNKYKGLLYKAEEIELEDGVVEALKLIHKKGHLAIVVTNQPIVARGLCQIEDVIQINNRLETLLGEQGVYVDYIVFCPHHPDKGYPEENVKFKVKCNCRKPNTGMLDECIKKFNIAKENSWIIGDTTIDIKTGINANIKTGLVYTGMAGEDKKYDVKANVEGENLYSVVEKCLESD